MPRRRHVKLARRRFSDEIAPPRAAQRSSGSGLPWLLGGLAAIVAAVWYLNQETPSDEAQMASKRDLTPVSELLARGILAPNDGVVHHRERADGVDARLQAFLDAWAASGPFRLVVPKDGGFRTDEATQEGFYAAGTSNAPTLAETPHGRGGAIDVAPYTRTAGGGMLWEPNYDYLAPFQVISSFAAAHGLVSGAHFGTLPGGDFPHVEVPDWKSLPFPPLALGVA